MSPTCQDGTSIYLSATCVKMTRECSWRGRWAVAACCSEACSPCTHLLWLSVFPAAPLAPLQLLLQLSHNGCQAQHPLCARLACTSRAGSIFVRLYCGLHCSKGPAASRSCLKLWDSPKAMPTCLHCRKSLAAACSCLKPCNGPTAVHTCVHCCKSPATAPSCHKPCDSPTAIQHMPGRCQSAAATRLAWFRPKRHSSAHDRACCTVCCSGPYLCRGVRLQCLLVWRRDARGGSTKAYPFEGG